MIGSPGAPSGAREGTALPLVRRLSTLLLALVATAWAAAMVVFGLTLMARKPGGWLESPLGYSVVAWVLLGLASIGAGQFVFMFMVADRLCPRVGRLPGIWVTELAIAGLSILSLLVVCAMALLGLVR